MAKKWTLMVYNNYDDPSIGILHLDIAAQLASVGANADIDVVILCDDMSSTTPITPLYYCRAGDPPGTLHEHPGWDRSEKDMAHPGTLVRFGTFVKTWFPADHYALVIACHGFGWTQGTVRWMSEQRTANLLAWLDAQATRSDWTAPLSPMPSLSSPPSTPVSNPASGLWRAMSISPDSTSQTEMSAIALGLALETIAQSIGRPIDLVAFDACHMQMAEIGFELARSVLTMVGPEWFGLTWDYADICARLRADPDQSPAQLARAMVDSYDAHHQANYTVRYTLSAIDLQALDSLRAYLNAFSAAMQYYPVDPATLTAVVRATQLLDGDKCYRDLGDFLLRLLYEDVSIQVWYTAAWLLHKLKHEVVIHHCAQSNATPAGLTEGSESYLDRTQGLSISLPLFSAPSDPNTWAYRDLRMSQQTGWDELLLSPVGPRL
jgi:hypothetical protein